MIIYLGKTGWDALLCLWNDIRSKVYTILISRYFYDFGKNSTIIPPFRYANPGLMSIGNYVTIHGNSWIQVVGPVEGQTQPKLTVEDSVCIGMNATISVCDKIEIQRNVFLARNVYISDHGHEFRDPTMPISKQGISEPKRVCIGADTWLGQNSVVLPGVKIGKHCVIGANSVVNRTIPDFSVAVGAPARVVRRYDRKTSTWERVWDSDQND
jgi:acetyltransferase-like isoleucine patch superfamily enzyme